ncbi:MAG: hypothetical protein ACR2OZ_08380 [Verrucomicrobiales bacterium]
MIARRTFLKATAGSSAACSLGNLHFLVHLPPVSAAEVEVDRRMVRFHSDTEPLVRLLEDTPRDRLLEEIAARIKRGLSYREIVAALLLAGVRNIQPRPVGFKFHAVLVVNSAHLASLASPESDRWLPIFWALDQFKSSQAADVREGNWTMGPVDEAAVPPSHKAKQAFIAAMDNWDEAAADAAVAGLARTAGASELFDIFARFGARDFRDIGHKAIYVANSFRVLEVIGWHHAEPVLRSLAYALLDRSGAPQNPAVSDLPADRPYRSNLQRVKRIREGWTEGMPGPQTTTELLQAIRAQSPSDTSEVVLDLLNRGTAPRAIFEALFTGAGEFLMQAPGIVSLHAMTFTNSVHYAWRRVQDDETRRLLLLQNAAFLPLYRGERVDSGLHLDTLEPVQTNGKGEEAVTEIFDDISKDRLSASRKVLAYLKNQGSAKSIADAGRRLIFLKGTNSHDYKFSSAVLEDYEHLPSPARDHLLAASMFYLRGSGDADNDLVRRIRGALGA